MANEIKVIADFYDFMLWMIQNPLRNHVVQASRECGLESPGFVPVPSVSEGRTDGRMHAVRSDWGGRPGADGPIRLVFERESDALSAGRFLRRQRTCA